MSFASLQMASKASKTGYIKSFTLGESQKCEEVRRRIKILKHICVLLAIYHEWWQASTKKSVLVMNQLAGTPWVGLMLSRMMLLAISP